jgi:hypothetical protein
MEGGTPIQLTFSNAADISPAWSKWDIDKDTAATSTKLRQTAWLTAGNRAVF